MAKIIITIEDKDIETSWVDISVLMDSSVDTTRDKPTPAHGVMGHFLSLCTEELDIPYDCIKILNEVT